MFPCGDEPSLAGGTRCTAVKKSTPELLQQYKNSEKICLLIQKDVSSEEKFGLRTDS